MIDLPAIRHRRQEAAYADDCDWPEARAWLRASTDDVYALIGEVERLTELVNCAGRADSPSGAPPP
jgi:hypothetical protein